MTITPTSKAAAVGSSVRNEPFAVVANVVPRKILIIGWYDPAKTAVVPDIPYRVFSPEQVGADTGYGFMLHRLAVQAYKGSRGIETWIIPQEEAGAPVQAAGDIDFTGSVPTQRGNIYLYIAGIMDQPVIVPVEVGDTAVTICSNVVDAINAIKELPVTAAINVTPEICDITAKSAGTWGNGQYGITLALNLRSGEELPPGVIAQITQLTGGAGTYGIQSALDALGTGDNANENFFTDLIHGYGGDLTSFDAILDYVGRGDTKTGLYGELVHRPFRTLTGSTLTGDAGLASLLVLGNLRKEDDRANGTIAVPGSKSHTEEISAQAIGHMARINNIRAEQNYVDTVLQDIHTGNPANRWTSEYINRDAAVKGGISPTFVKNNAVVMQNVVTYYHPDAVPPNSNGYASFRNLSIIQNLLDSQYRTFNVSDWTNFTIVEDVTKVANTTDREKVKDIDAVIDRSIAMYEAWRNNAWIYETDFAIQELSKPGSVTIRGGTDGFDVNHKVILSGEGLILNNTTIFDTSIAVLNQ